MFPITATMTTTTQSTREPRQNCICSYVGGSSVCVVCSRTILFNEQKKHDGNEFHVTCYNKWVKERQKCGKSLEGKYENADDVQVVTTVSLNKDNGNHNEPKRPKTAWLIYSTNIRSEFRNKYPEAHFGDLTRKISESWKNLSDIKKKEYEDKAIKDKERYKEEFKIYKSTKEYKSDEDSDD